MWKSPLQLPAFSVWSGPAVLPRARAFLREDLELAVALLPRRQGIVRQGGLPAEGEPAGDLHLVARELQHVVAGLRVAAEPQRRDRAGVRDVHVLEPPHP